MSFTYDTIIENGIIVPTSSDKDIIENGKVLIKDGRIEKILKNEDSEDSPTAPSVIDARGRIIMPGLVNSHTHIPMSLFRGLADDLPLDKWLNDHIFPAESAFITSENVFWASLLSIAELLLSGVTTFCDGYFYEESVAKAVVTSGIRAVLGQGVIDFPAPGVPDPEKNVDHAVSFVNDHKSISPLIVPSIFCHSPYACSEKTLQKAKEAALKENVLFQIHVSETRQERDNSIKTHGKSPIVYLDDLGILDEKTLLVHSVWTASGDTAVIKKSGASVSHNPESNMKLASGIAPIPQFLNEGISVGLGTDGAASNNNLDLFQEMDITAKLHKVTSLNPTVTGAQTVLNMATHMGAKTIGLKTITGKLKPGMAADIIIIDTNKVHLTPMYHPISHLVYAVNGSDVNDVMVNGKWVVRDRNLLTFDLNEVMDRVNQLASKIVS